MPIIEGVGDEVLLTIALYVPVTFLVPYLADYVLPSAQRAVVNIIGKASALIKRCVTGIFKKIALFSFGKKRVEATAIVQEENPCPVCQEEMSEISLPCISSCGHCFCGSCIIKVWEYGGRLSICHCPMCRSPIKYFVSLPRGDYLPQTEGERQTMRDLQLYNHLFGEVSIFQKIARIPLLFRHLLSDFCYPERALAMLNHARFGIFTVIVVLYLLSPFDLISEGVYGIFGMVDDIVLIIVVAYQLLGVYRSWMAGEIA